MWRSTSLPSMPGSMTSRMTTSNWPDSAGRGPVRAIEGRGRADAFARKILGQHFAQGGVVIDEKDVQIDLLQALQCCARQRPFVSRLFTFFTVYWRTLYPAPARLPSSLDGMNIRVAPRRACIPPDRRRRFTPTRRNSIPAPSILDEVVAGLLWMSLDLPQDVSRPGAGDASRINWWRGSSSAPARSPSKAKSLSCNRISLAVPANHDAIHGSGRPHHQRGQRRHLSLAFRNLFTSLANTLRHARRKYPIYRMSANHGGQIRGAIQCHFQRRISEQLPACRPGAFPSPFR